MIKLGKIEIEGFCSIQDLEIPLDGSGIIMISGRNGSGKSTLLNAITWAIYGKTLKSATSINTLKQFQPKGYKGTKVTLHYEIDGIFHKIIRCSSYDGNVEGAKGKNRLIYYVDLVPQETKGVKETQKLIEENLGLSFKLFKNSIVFGQRIKRIIQESNTDKKELFEEAFRLGFLANARELANKYKREKGEVLQKALDKYNNLISHYKETKSLYDENVKAEKDFKKEQKRFKKSLQKSIDQNMLKRRKLAKSLSRKNIKDLEKVYSSQQKELEDIKTIELTLNKEINKHTTGNGLSDFLKDVIDLMDDGKYTPAHKKLIQLYEFFTKREAIQEKRHDLSNKVATNIDKIKKYKQISKEILEIDKDINRLETDLESQEIKDKVRNKNYKAKLSKTKKEILRIREELVLLREDFEIYDWALKDPLSNNGIKIQMFNHLLTLLNDELRAFSNLTGLNIWFDIDNNVKRDIITNIEINGQELDYGDLSGGEQGLVEVITAFSIHSIVTSSKAVNVLFLDEVFENLDSDNIEIVVDIINHVATTQNKTVYIITHQDNVRAADSRVWNVEKDEKGCTTISYK